jgi:3-hydroxymyristoyl/3-hydroxydecanoyl-(acyl carrier protein) dehydratase
VVPGDQLIFEVELVAKRSTFAKIRGRALVDGVVVCEAEMMSALADR